MRMKPSPLPHNGDNILTEINRNRWRTLASVNEMIESLTKRLKDMHLLERTYLIFMSDNG